MTEHTGTNHYKPPNYEWDNDLDISASDTVFRVAAWGEKTVVTTRQGLTYKLFVVTNASAPSGCNLGDLSLGEPNALAVYGNYAIVGAGEGLVTVNLEVPAQLTGTRGVSNVSSAHWTGAASKGNTVYLTSDGTAAGVFSTLFDNLADIASYGGGAFSDVCSNDPDLFLASADHVYQYATFDHGAAPGTFPGSPSATSSATDGVETKTVGLAISGTQLLWSARDSVFVLKRSDLTRQYTAFNGIATACARRATTTGDFIVVADSIQGLSLFHMLPDNINPTYYYPRAFDEWDATTFCAMDMAFVGSRIVTGYQKGVKAVRGRMATQTVFSNTPANSFYIKDFDGIVYGTFTIGNTLYFFDSRGHLYSLDATDPNSDPVLINIPGLGHPLGATIYGSYVIMAGIEGLWIVDPNAGALIASTTAITRCSDVAVYGDGIFISCYEGPHFLFHMDLVTTGPSFNAGSVVTLGPEPSRAWGLGIQGSNLIVATLGGVSFFDAVELGHISDDPTPDAPCWGVAVSSQYIFVANDSMGVRVYDNDLELYHPIPRLAANDATHGIVFGVKTDADFLYVGTKTVDSMGGFAVYQLRDFATLGTLRTFAWADTFPKWTNATVGCGEFMYVFQTADHFFVDTLFSGGVYNDTLQTPSTLGSRPNGPYGIVGSEQIFYIRFALTGDSIGTGVGERANTKDTWYARFWKTNPIAANDVIRRPDDSMRIYIPSDPPSIDGGAGYLQLGDYYRWIGWKADLQKLSTASTVLFEFFRNVSFFRPHGGELTYSDGVHSLSLDLRPDSSATDGWDSAFEPSLAHRDAFDAWFVIPRIGEEAIFSHSFIYDVFSPGYLTTITLHGDGVLSWSTADFQNGEFLVQDSLNMARVGSIACHDGQTITIRYRSTTPIWSRVPVHPGWNALSFPTRIRPGLDTQILDRWPGTIVHYRVEPGWKAYDQARSLLPGVGYLLFSPRETLLSYGGEPMLRVEIPVHPGWNLIGTSQLAHPLEVAAWVALQGGLIPDGRVYGYDPTGNEFVPVDQIVQGKAYYVFCATAGTLTMSSRSGSFPRPIRPDFGTRFSISLTDAFDRSVVLGLDPFALDDVDPQDILLPPAPDASERPRLSDAVPSLSYTKAIHAASPTEFLLHWPEDGSARIAGILPVEWSALVERPEGWLALPLEGEVFLPRGDWRIRLEPASLSLPEWSLLENPVRTRLVLLTPGPVAACDYRIYDISGRMLASGLLEAGLRRELDVSALSEGKYWLEVGPTEGRQVIGFVRE